MRYLLDTNICIYYFKGLFDLNSKFQEAGFSQIAISEITLAELFFGAANSQQIEKNMKLIENFSGRIAIIPLLNCYKFYGKEKARLKSIGKPISDFDLLIGASSVVNKMILITRNTREFERISDINIENWIDK